MKSKLKMGFWMIFISLAAASVFAKGAGKEWKAINRIANDLNRTG